MLDRGTFKETKFRLNELWGNDKHFEHLSKHDKSVTKGYINAFQSAIANHTILDAGKAREYIAKALKHLPDNETLAHSITNGHNGAAELHMGEYEKASKHLDKAKDYAKIIKYSLMYLLWWSYRVQVDVEIGNLKKAKNEIEIIIQYAKECGVNKSNVFSNAIICLGRIYFEWNDLEKAETYFKQGIELAESKEYTDRLLLGYFSYLPYLIAVKDIVTSKEKITKARELSHGMNNPSNVQKLIDALEIRIALYNGDLTTAKHMYDSLFLEPHERKSRLAAFKQHTLADYYLRTDQLDKCIELLHKLIEIESEGIRKVELIKYRVTLARAYAEKHQYKKGHEQLHKSLILAENESYIRTFVDGGILIKELLQDILKEIQKPKSNITQPSPLYVKKLLEEFRLEEERLHNLKMQKQCDSIDKILTNREIEVVSNLALGLSYTEIANKMYISENTLRSHIKNIYKKLHARNRTEAILEAEKMLLI